MKKLRTSGSLITLLTAAMVLACVAGYSRGTTAAPNPLALKANCDEVLGAPPSSAPLVVELFDRTSKPSSSNLQRLAKPACRSLHGAREVARKDGKDYDWMSNFPFVMEDLLDGHADQAQFRRGLWLAEFPRSVYVGAGMFSAYSDDEMVWVIGHELGHGVHEHNLWKKGIALGGAAIALIALLTSIGIKKPTCRKVARAIFGIVALATVLGIYHLSPRQELICDVFGVNVLAQAGQEFDGAKATAVRVIERHGEAAESLLSKVGVIPDSHPRAKVRIGNIKGST